MAKSRLRDDTEPVVFVLEVAKQHDVSLLRYCAAWERGGGGGREGMVGGNAGSIALGVLGISRVSF